MFKNFGLKKEKEYFMENLAMLIGAGLGIVSSLSAISQQIQSRAMRRIIQELSQKIEQGIPLWKSLESVQIFPARIISLVRTGEKAGQLPGNLRLIASQEQKNRIFLSKIKSAMMYPVIVFSLAVVIGIGLAWFILPKLALTFSQLNMEMPWITKALIKAGRFFGLYGSIVGPAFLIILAFAVFFLFFFSKTKFAGQAIFFRFPVIKDLIQQTELARFGYLLGILLESGLSVIEAIDSLYQAESFYNYKDFYLHLRDRVEQGNSFQKSFLSYPRVKKLIPVPIQQMVFAGEKSGRLSDILLKIGEIFEQKAETTAKNLAILLEPIFLIIIWVCVFLVALAVILPIYSLIGGF